MDLQELAKKHQESAERCTQAMASASSEMLHCTRTKTAQRELEAYQKTFTSNPVVQQVHGWLLCEQRAPAQAARLLCALLTFAAFYLGQPETIKCIHTPYGLKFARKILQERGDVMHECVWFWLLFSNRRSDRCYHAVQASKMKEPSHEHCRLPVYPAARCVQVARWCHFESIHHEAQDANAGSQVQTGELNADLDRYVPYVVSGLFAESTPYAPLLSSIWVFTYSLWNSAKYFCTIPALIYKPYCPSLV
jgi:hypothetical protein